MQMETFNKFAVKEQVGKLKIKPSLSSVLSTCLSLSAVLAASLNYDDKLHAEAVCVW